MKTIVAIIGDSGSGKTTAAKYMADIFGFNMIVSYTTRPIRPFEIDGIDHWFVGTKNKPKPEDMCAYTQFGGYEYWTTWEQIQEGTNLYVIDEKGLENLKVKTNCPFEYVLITVKINRRNRESIDEERKQRDSERIYIPDESYDFVVNNDSTMSRFRLALDSVALHIVLGYK